MFPEDLLGLPPIREIDFYIKMLPMIALISKELYRLAPEELKELKE